MAKLVLWLGLVIGIVYAIIMVIIAWLNILPIGSILGIYGIFISVDGLFIFMLWSLFTSGNNECK